MSAYLEILSANTFPKSHGLSAYLNFLIYHDSDSNREHYSRKVIHTFTKDDPCGGFDKLIPHSVILKDLYCDKKRLKKQLNIRVEFNLYLTQLNVVREVDLLKATNFGCV